MTTNALNASPVGALPSRELRLLLEGIKNWVESIGRDGGAKPLAIVEGDVGHGKSLLMRALGDFAPSLGMRVVGGSFRRRSSLPGGAFRDVLDQLLREPHASDPTVQRVLEKFGGDLRRLFPSPRWPDSCRVVPDIDPEDGRSRLIDSVACALLELGRKSPTVVILEEVETSDRLSVEIYRHLVRLLEKAEMRRRSHRLLLVVTRTVTAGETSVDDDPSITAFRLRARGYSREDIREFVQRGSKEMSLSQREGLYRETQGNVRRVRLLLGPSEAGSDHHLDGADAGDMGSLLRRRFDAAGDTKQSILSWLAATGIEPSIGDLARALASDLSAARSFVDGQVDEWFTVTRELEADGWVRPLTFHSDSDGRRVSIEEDVQPLVLAWAKERVAACVENAQSFLFGDCAADGASDANGAADAEDTSAVDPDVSFDRRADWVQRAFAGSTKSAILQVARVSEVVRETSETVIAHFESFGAYAEALELLEGVFGELAATDRTLDLLERAGHYREGLDLVSGSIDSLSEQEDVARAWVRVAAFARGLEEEEVWEEAIGEASAALAEIESVELSARVSLERARWQVASEALADARATVDAAVESLQSAGDAAWGDLRCDLLGVGVQACEAGRAFEDAARYEEQRLDLAVALGNKATSILARAELARWTGLSGRALEAEELLEAALEDAIEAGARLLKARVLWRLGELYTELGRFDSAHRTLCQARWVFEDFGAEELVHRVEIRLLETDLRLGRFATAAQTIWDVVERQFGLDVAAVACERFDVESAERELADRQSRQSRESAPAREKAQPWRRPAVHDRGVSARDAAGGTPGSSTGRVSSSTCFSVATKPKRGRSSEHRPIVFAAASSRSWGTSKRLFVPTRRACVPWLARRTANDSATRTWTSHRFYASAAICFVRSTTTFAGFASSSMRTTPRERSPSCRPSRSSSSTVGNRLRPGGRPW